MPATVVDKVNALVTRVDDVDGERQDDSTSSQSIIDNNNLTINIGELLLVFHGKILELCSTFLN